MTQTFSTDELADAEQPARTELRQPGPHETMWNTLYQQTAASAYTAINLIHQDVNRRNWLHAWQLATQLTDMLGCLHSMHGIEEKILGAPGLHDIR